MEKLDITPLVGVDGLGPWADDLPPKSREYIRRAYDFFRLDPLLPPSQQVMPAGDSGKGGTVPEMVVLGGLLARRYSFGGGSARSFANQDWVLGGRRIPGGAVVDTVVFLAGEVVAVRVESVFHAPNGVFAGGAKVEQDRNQRIRLESRGGYQRIVDVNRYSDGFPLENGPDALVDRDFDRIEGKVP